jgi:hypothetical protein
MVEFLLLFLICSLAFIGMRIYFKRGINAKLKHIEIQLNAAASSSQSIEAQEMKKVYWNLNGYGGSCGGEDLEISKTALSLLACQYKLWHERGCPMRTSAEQLCSKYGMCPSSECFSGTTTLQIYTTWPDGATEDRWIGICLDEASPTPAFCISGPGPSPCPQECKSMQIIH